jgi:23S rRNA (cytosine1962-C5)-methyltransferase
MSTSSHRPAVVVRKGRETSLRRRHPWVFSGAIADRQGTLKAGCLVDVKGADGRVLGVGHWGTKGIAVRMLAFSAVGDEIQLLHERLNAAITLRRELRLVGSDTTTGFRLVHGEGDDLPGLVVDVYGDTAVIQCHSPGMWRLRSEVKEYLLGAPNLKLVRVVYRLVESQVGDVEQDENDDSESVPTHIENPDGSPADLTFIENGLRFLVDVSAGQKTGFFLDQRSSRQRIRELSRGRHVLNAFSYTGAFSVYALAGGAESVCSVDASKAAIDLCRQNVVLNFAKTPHQAEVADCFEYLAQIPDTFDLIILDPPAFAKHQRAIQRALRGYETINTLALKKIRAGGIVATFSCSQLVSRELFRESVLRAAAAAGRRVKILEHFHQASCHPTNIFHPEGDYLKGLALYVE